jgi:FAD/FMN-containing dehydrogenase
MANEEVGRHRTQPVRIIHMSVAPADPRPSADALVIVAKLAGPDQEELQWWMEQLRDRVKVRSWVGSPGGLTSVQVDAPEDQFEAVARRLIAAVDEANAAYPEHYAAWRREHDALTAEERLRKERRIADYQAILDRVMDEYRSN